MNWSSIFGTDPAQLAEMVLRGTIMYAALFTLLRLIRREMGSFSVADLLVLVILADAAQNGMAGTYQSIPDGLVLVATILFWAYAIDVVAYHVPAFARLVRPGPELLVRDGRLMQGNLRRNFISRDELLSHIRAQGLDRVEQVRRAYLEGDGQISVVPIEEKEAGSSAMPNRGAQA